ncbi:MAG: hypothetical protein RLZZ164_474 [Actinomycetota bacterium]|jgi:hypothetical protein
MNTTKTKNPKALLEEIREQLGYYVYALVDPRSKKVFYVGKGKGDRILAHAKDAKDSKEVHTAKFDTIREIHAKGLEVDHYFIRIGMKSEKEAFIAEQGAIDALLLTGVKLTNIAGGHGSHQQGGVALTELMQELAAQPADPIGEPTIIFKVNRLWHKKISDKDLADVTRGYWRVGLPARQRGQIAVAVANGLIRGVYRIKPNSWHNGNRNSEVKNRWGFEVLPAKEYQDQIGRQVRTLFPKGSQTPFRLFLDGFPGAGKISAKPAKSHKK